MSKGQASEKWGPCLCEAGSGACHSTVKVESRTWPGINKPGGVGRVTKRTMGEAGYKRIILAVIIAPLYSYSNTEIV